MQPVDIMAYNSATKQSFLVELQAGVAKDCRFFAIFTS